MSDKSSEPIDLDAWMAAMAEVLQLEIAPQYEAGIKANLAVAARMAALIDRLPLEDAAEPAPVYRP